MFFTRTSVNLPGAVTPHKSRRRRAGLLGLGGRRDASRWITGIDIGTTKVCAIIGSIDTAGNLTIHGIGSAPSRGMLRGVVTNISETVSAVHEAYDQALQLAHAELDGYRPKDILVGIAGDHISGINLEGMVEVAHPEAGIDDRDLKRVKKKALKLILPQDQETLHTFVKEYVVNEQPGITDPRGLFGSRLQIRMHVVTSSVPAANNIFRCVRKAGLRTGSVVLQSLASSLAVLQPRERELGVVLVDIGGGTSDIAIFGNNTLQHISELAMGGDIITSDIAKLLRCTPHEAENLKKKFGHSVPLEVDADERIELPAPVAGKKRRVHRRRELAEIIEARVEEIMFEIKRQIERAGVDNRVYGGLVLTGGTALLEGIDVVAERVLGYPCRIGRPQGLLGMGSVINTPIYSTVVGLLRWAVEEGNGYRKDPWMLKALKKMVSVYG